MKSFEDWYSLLISDTLWYELLRAYKPDTIKKAGEKVFAGLVADGTVEARPMSENRKHVYNIVTKNPGDKPAGKEWYLQEMAKVSSTEENNWKPVSPEERARRLAEWEAIVKGSTMANSMPKPSYKQLAEEGGVLPPKPAPYPVTKPEEAYVRDRHFEWIKNNFEARTGQKLPNWICEEDWNIVYDEKHLTDKGL